MSNYHKGIIYMVLSAFGFSMMNVFSKLSGDFPPFQKVFIRSLVILAFSTGLVLKEKDSFFPKKENRKLMFIRSFAGSIAMFCNYYAVDNLILSDATMIGKLSPFFTIIFSFILLKENIKPYQIISILIGLFGTGFIVKPELSSSTLPALIGLLGAVLAGFAYTLVRRIGNNGEKNATMVFSFALFSAIISLPLMIINFVPISIKEILILVLSGFFAFIGQTFVTEAYSLAPAREISIFDFSQLLFAALSGFILFSEKPDKLSILGYLIILSASIYMFVKNNKESQLKKAH